MNIGNIKQAATRTASRGALVGKKYSPQILTGVGIVSGVAAAVMASKATLKAQPIVADAKEFLEVVRDNKASLSDRDYAKELSFAYARPGIQLAKVYAPALSLGSASILCVISAQGIMQRRNAGLAAAYVAVEKGLAEYRKRVEVALGADKERELFYNTTMTEMKNESGKVEKVEIFDPNGVSIYAKFFDEYNPNWTKTPEYNLLFLKAQQNYFNDLLKARGHVFLNDVYDGLGIDRSQAGQVVGWVLNAGGDNFIDFGIFNGTREPVREFVNGRERSILLDFNVDGVVLDLI